MVKTFKTIYTLFVFHTVILAEKVVYMKRKHFPIREMLSLHIHNYKICEFLGRMIVLSVFVSMDKNDIIEKFDNSFVKIVLFVVLVPMCLIYVLLFAGLETRVTISK